MHVMSNGNKKDADGLLICSSFAIKMWLLSSYLVLSLSHPQFLLLSCQHIAHTFFSLGDCWRAMNDCELNAKRHRMVFAWLVLIHKYADDSSSETSTLLTSLTTNFFFFSSLPSSHSLCNFFSHILCVCVCVFDF
jgi:hypothetical protein